MLPYEYASRIVPACRQLPPTLDDGSGSILLLLGHPSVWAEKVRVRTDVCGHQSGTEHWDGVPKYATADG